MPRIHPNLINNLRQQNMNQPMTDTIYALATPQGKSAIAVIRLSGPLSRTIPALFGHSKQIAPRQVSYISLLDAGGKILDDVIFFWFEAPASATGEDMAEIQCHGSAAVIEDVLKALAAASGFKMAQPGEFTRRALDNDKIDMTAAEGLADLIDAETALQRQQATAQMKGRLKQPVSEWRDAIISQAALLESLIDFADEELPETLAAEMSAKLTSLIDALEHALDDGQTGELIRSGIEVAIIGPVNAGKSTALNALAKRPAAIISQQEGTTRDVIEVKLNIGGIPVILLDTAGIRDTEDDIERQGIELARHHAKSADFRLFVVDGSVAGWQKQLSPLLQYSQGKGLIIANKADLGSPSLQNEAVLDGIEILSLSLHRDQDIETLERKLAEHLAVANHQAGNAIITRARHREALTTAYHHLISARERDIESQTELVAEEFRAAATALSRILGYIDVEDILDHIFSRFCIGK